MADEQYIVNELIPDFLRIISKEYPIDRVILYGSYAKGYATKMSDIDIAVILNSDNKKDRYIITNRLYKIAQKIDVRIEPRCFFIDEINNAESASIISEIIKTGHVIN
ncbi:MAG: polymerase beta domain protein region [Ignavibacteria bacterium]|nr:polymerase beta domain protein region [Ignavibacteria bacterium]